MSPKALPSKKQQDTVPQRKAGKTIECFAALLCFSARKYLQDGCSRCARPLLCAWSVDSFTAMSHVAWRGLTVCL